MQYSVNTGMLDDMMIETRRKMGVWNVRLTNRLSPDGRGVLLDRDGVVVQERNYLRRPKDVELIPSVVHLVHAANQYGIPVAVITNQSGIDRGIFSWEDFSAVEAEIDRQLRLHNVTIDLKIACPFHPDHTPGYNQAMAGWRKPGPKMAILACQTLGLDPRKTWMVGDKASDIQTAKAANLAGAYFFRGEYQADEPKAVALADDRFWVRAVDAHDPIDLSR